nr:MAG TPA: hypothetical protein [Caudoviricetes sp.]
MRVSCSPGWVSWTGSFLGHDEVYRAILSTASRRLRGIASRFPADFPVVPVDCL